MKFFKLLRHLFYNKLARYIPFLRVFYETQFTQTPVTFSMWFLQKIIGINRKAYFPVHISSVVFGIKNIYAGIEVSPGKSPGCYIQGIGTVYIGDYTQIAPNVGIISANHDLYNNRKGVVSSVIIGKYCWIGMGAIILPGVRLGDNTIVGAGSIVTKSFPGGYCVIAGNPAKLVKSLDREKCVRHKSLFEYNGYIKASKFEQFVHDNLNSELTKYC
ncbi:MAG: acyltransferase [Candidatus Electrothrix sp. AR5]|nr:acyltransferase [Candidatus Electrothrix sp. AR5]